MQVFASIAIAILVAAFMTLTFIAAWLVTFLVGVTSLSVFYAAWAIISIAGTILLRRLARMLEFSGINLN